MDSEVIISLSPQMILSLNLLDELYDEEDPLVKARNLALYSQRAKQLNLDKEARALLKAYEEKEREENRKFFPTPIELERDGRGMVMNTISNFVRVLENDSAIKRLNLRFNLLTDSPEKCIDGITMPWTDDDDANIRNLIENRYHMHHVAKCDDAMRIVFSKNSYHPVRDLINSFVWDGKSRIYDFLHEWMKCENTPYTREVSRLIFAGGINRLYNPGCKFDDMPVLIGTKQGEGKSTIVRWLALKDKYFTEVTEIEGQKGMEAVEGAWMCEMGELLALTRAREVEAVKSFLTRQADKYRKPYDKHVTEHERQCIFIGTTNREQFLTDKTGNRRFYPVRVYQTGYELYSHEKECRRYIQQCWAEAKALYDKGELKAFADYSLLGEIRAQQESAVEEDYRIGLIEKYVAGLSIVCSLQIWRYALGNEFAKMDKKSSMEIGMILDSLPGWERTGRKYVDEFGRQRCWERITDAEDDDFDEICL